MESHAERKHSILSASGAERWFNCTPSARLEDEYGIKKTSVFAEEGTTAHELADLMLTREATEALTDEVYLDQLTKIMNKDNFDDEMLIEVPKYVDYCVEQFEAAKLITPDAMIAIEQHNDLSTYIPDGKGTCDCEIIVDGELEVIDLKYGKGVAVSATANKQLMLYGLGALLKYDVMYNITTVKLTIVQPRLDSISSWIIPVIDLLAWANSELTEKAKIAFEGKGELNAGSWCKFCAIKFRCTKIAETNLELAKYEFAKPKFLTDTEIAAILVKVPLLVEWANGLADYATTEAYTNNKVWPGFKLVEGQSRRKWISEEAVYKSVKAKFPGCEDSELYNEKFKSITDIEKLLGKKEVASKLTDVIIKPQGKPTLVPNSDNRTAMGLGQAKLDFQ